MAAITGRLNAVFGGAEARPRPPTTLSRVGASVARGSARAFANVVPLTATAEDLTERPATKALLSIAVSAPGAVRLL